MTDLKSIVLAEDNLKDVELTLEAISEHSLTNDVVVVLDGADALDYLYYRGSFKKLCGRKPGGSPV